MRKSKKSKEPCLTKIEKNKIIHKKKLLILKDSTSTFINQRDQGTMKNKTTKYSTAIGGERFESENE